jgi:hypothetical protein
MNQERSLVGVPTSTACRQDAQVHLISHNATTAFAFDASPVFEVAPRSDKREIMEEGSLK